MIFFYFTQQTAKRKTPLKARQSAFIKAHVLVIVQRAIQQEVDVHNVVDKSMVEERDYISFNNLKQTLTCNYFKFQNYTINFTFNINNNKKNHLLNNTKKNPLIFPYLSYVDLSVSNSNTTFLFFLIEIGHKKSNIKHHTMKCIQWIQHCNGKKEEIKLTINSINKEINNNKTVKKSII